MSTTLTTIMDVRLQCAENARWQKLYLYDKLDDNELSKMIQNLRQRLVLTVSEKNNFTDKEVVLLSQELDVYILEYQKKTFHKELRQFKVNH
ncbi:aspartyl-phosphate phosphatase Spo0E family protein [Paenibacillus apiarius]|uniref:Spo0E family sporulation regulatory protein-aspartic acid phosphatase n=2 Tax=Paenibacillus apiarius TaxID=46240 RepID=UPI000B3B7BC6